MTNQLGYDPEDDDVDDFDADADGSFEQLRKRFCEYNYDPHERLMSVYGVDMSHASLQLALALLVSVGQLEDSIATLRAAYALRRLTGIAPAPESAEVADFNRQHAVGRLVQAWPAGRNGESYLTRTESPAFTTAAGSFLIVEDLKEAVPLFNVQPSAVSHRDCEVMQCE